MHYQLWDTETGNLVGDYRTESEALAVVRRALRLRGPAAVEALSLGQEFDDETLEDTTLTPVLAGADLLARAQAAERTERQRESP
jgi:hypothetical protein